jgi:hypothetical protein
MKYKVEFQIVQTGYYEIEAASADEAEAMATERYETESEPSYRNVFSEMEITGCKRLSGKSAIAA